MIQGGLDWGIHVDPKIDQGTNGWVDHYIYGSMDLWIEGRWAEQEYNAGGTARTALTDLLINGLSDQYKSDQGIDMDPQMDS